MAQDHDLSGPGARGLARRWAGLFGLASARAGASMKYLVTGGGGFIGTHLAAHLLSEGHTVTTLDPKRCALRGVFHIYGSAADPQLMTSLIPRHDGVFHLAAVVGFAKVMPHLVQTVTETTSTAATVFSICAQTQTRMLFTSTSAVYGRGNGHPAKETDDALVGPSPVQSWSYAYAKAAAECLAFSYVREAKAPFIVTRVFNTVGPGQSAEAGRGLLDLMECDQAVGELVNVGGTAHVTMQDLAQLVLARAQSASPIATVPAPYKVGYDDIESRRPDLTKAGRLVDYAPTHSLSDMVDAVLDSQCVPTAVLV